VPHYLSIKNSGLRKCEDRMNDNSHLDGATMSR
jgi:hypothetical protein